MSLPRDKNVSYYAREVPEIPDATKKILEKYSKIPPEQVNSHCFKIRDEAWEIYPYPCIGTFRFLDVSVSRFPNYDEIIQRLRTNNQVLLDLGCCFGQDLRHFVYDGAPSENLYGCDLRLDFMNIGYDLFLDKNTLKSKFLAADVFDDQSALETLKGKIDIIVSSAFFHLFDLERQKVVARLVVRLLKPRKDSLLVGRQIGNLTPMRREYKHRPGTHVFRHNVETWKEFWNEVGEETGTRWDVQAELEGHQRMPVPSQTQEEIVDGDMRWLVFAVRRLE
ncbi:hypothetical protein ANO11243_001390 [Dothideomycetidae sp. 11243]|nr:hypothetical protein ANO11243_001390 [fungal sp. No.11243]